MSDFLAFCRAHGILIDALPPMGVWRRYKTDDKPRHRNGAVKWLGDHGHCQNHATETEVSTWHDERSAIDPAKAAANEARMRAARQSERDKRRKAMQGARRFWVAATARDGPHPYIERKGLSQLGCFGLRTHGELLVVPVWFGKSLVSVQTIAPDGTKRFWPGAPVSGGSYVIERPRAALTAFCEGLATGLAVHQAVRQARVVVTFDCGNLGRVIQRMKPTGSVVICADNDHGTQARRGVNPGMEAARNAAELIGCGVAYPQGIEGTDFADLLAELGDGAARRMERLILAQARMVYGGAMT